MTFLKLFIVLTLTVVPILVLISEIKSIINDGTNHLNHNHKNHHIAILGMVLVLILSILVLTIKIRVPFEDVIFVFISMFLVAIYSAIHLRAERKNKSLDVLTGKMLLKLIYKKIKELVIWK